MLTPEIETSILPAQVNQLELLYRTMKDKVISEEEAVRFPATKILKDTLKYCIREGELINIAVRGPVRKGKSTVMIALAMEINKLIIKYNQNSEEIIKNMQDYIFSDQIEFNRFTTEDIRNVCIMIDEFNTMGKTGANATTEHALLEYYSDVFAVQYVHRVTASPSYIIDKNAWIIIDVEGRIKKRGYTRCKLMYRDIISRRIVTLGHIDIYVGELIKNWEAHVKPIMNKKQRTKEEEKEITRWKKIDLYVKYQVKKRERLKLLQEHGLRDIREAEFALIILKTTESLEHLAKLRKISKDIIGTTVDRIRRDEKRIYSLITTGEIISKSKGMLDQLSNIAELMKTIQTNPRRRYGKLTDEEIRIMNNEIKKFKKGLQKDIAEQRKLSKIYKKYITIQ